jgi:hypothetical protein
MQIRTMLLALSIGTMLTALATAAEAQEPLRERMNRNHVECNRGDRAACVRFGILIGENRERQADWRREHQDWWWWERR